MNSKIIALRPPRLALFLILVATLAHWFLPRQWIDLFPYPMLGLLLAVTGFILTLWGWWLFKQAGTAIRPTDSNKLLVTRGIYRYTRNPMYLGLILILATIAVFYGTIPFYVSTIAFFVIINGFFCPYEEHKLIAAFGDEYLVYKNQVRRWV